MERFILALDQGTTSSRAILFDRNGMIAGVSQQEFPQRYPKPGWVEQDPRDILASQLAVARQVMKDTGISAEHIAAVGITNQRETTVVWDRKSGEPLGNAIVWQDRRTAEYCESLRQGGHEQRIRETCGLVIDSYFSGPKIRWILDNIPGARSRAREGKLAFGTIDSWLVWNLTGGAHLTDATNASRTMLYDINRLCWDDDLLAIMDIPPSLLPEVRSSSERYGLTHPSIFGASLPVTGIAGDQQAALFGQACTGEGMIKNTYGTGSFVMMHTGNRPTLSRNNLLTTIALCLNDSVTYALEGSIFVAGAVVQWLRDGLGIIKASSEVEALACSVPDNGGVFLVPAFTGLGAPHWDPYARGILTGITRGTTAGHIARAALEGIAFQVRDVVQAMMDDAAVSAAELRVDGGASPNNTLLQFQADILGIPVVRPAVGETTALGAAFLAGLAVEFWSGPDDLETTWRRERTFTPLQEPDRVERLLADWRRALAQSTSGRDGRRPHDFPE